MEIAALAAAELGLPANSPQASRFARRKDLARARLAQHGLAVPLHRLIDLRRLRETAPDGQSMVSAHRSILYAVARRNAKEAATRMRAHIERRRDSATQAVREAYAQLYVPDL